MTKWDDVMGMRSELISEQKKEWYANDIVTEICVGLLILFTLLTIYLSIIVILIVL